MGIPKQSTSKILPKPMAQPYADQKSKIMTHNIHVSQLHHVHQTQYFNEWVGFRPFKLQIKFLQGSEFFQKYIDGNGNWFYSAETYSYNWSVILPEEMPIQRHKSVTTNRV